MTFTKYAVIFVALCVVVGIIVLIIKTISVMSAHPSIPWFIFGFLMGIITAGLVMYTWLKVSRKV
jgi:hypothetical protein